jgi:hypothetical protein
MASVESPQFYAFVNVANNLKTFVRALTMHPAVQHLWRQIDDPRVGSAIFSRTIQIANQPAPTGSEHPLDAALAAYLYLLAACDQEVALIAANNVVDHGQLWWARKIAQGIKEGANSRSNTSVKVFLSSNSQPVDYTAHAGKALTVGLPKVVGAWKHLHCACSFRLSCKPGVIQMADQGRVTNQFTNRQAASSPPTMVRETAR